MPRSDTPKWPLANLATHHQSRINKDDACCRDVLEIGRAMTQAEYQDCSYAAYELAVIEYVGDIRENGKRVNRIDKRGIRTVTDLYRQAMITCFHEHCDRPHEPGSSREPMVEVVTRALRHLGNQLDGKVARLYAIELVKENLKTKHRKKGAALPTEVAALADRVSHSA